MTGVFRVGLSHIKAFDIGMVAFQFFLLLHMLKGEQWIRMTISMYAIQLYHTKIHMAIGYSP